jgi:hypothetical protein
MAITTNALRSRLNTTPASIGKRMLLGLVIGIVIISIFIFPVEEPHPEWGKYWRIRPLIVTPLVAAFGILSFYLKDLVRPRHKGIAMVLLLLSLLVFLISLWIGIILGLDGTLWN